MSTLEEKRAKARRQEEYMRIGMRIAFEFGYRECEKNKNLQAALMEFDRCYPKRS